MAYSKNGNQITFTEDNIVDFEYPVDAIFEVDNILVVILKIPNGVYDRRNVFAFDRVGNFLWQIKDVPLYYKGKDCPFVGALINDQNELVLFNWCDTAVIVEPSTGDLVRTYQTK
ncbi:hypothetical protein ACEN9X_08195 [Mucilaginibacter sp. Mucisp86]|uniref:hypothetical protein n=1 Tax=Mucilaginibacter sp. Mucisp86 TaxID=3243060 RepID=UPI0039B44DC0